MFLCIVCPEAGKILDFPAYRREDGSLRQGDGIEIGFCVMQ